MQALPSVHHYRINTSIFRCLPSQYIKLSRWYMYVYVKKFEGGSPTLYLRPPSMQTLHSVHHCRINTSIFRCLVSQYIKLSRWYVYVKYFEGWGATPTHLHLQCKPWLSVHLSRINTIIFHYLLSPYIQLLRCYAYVKKKTGVYLWKWLPPLPGDSYAMAQYPNFATIGWATFVPNLVLFSKNAQ